MVAWTRAAGLALILIGIAGYGIWYRWSSARKWEPLNIPVSLSPGHIRTPAFEISTRATYRISFVAADGFGHNSEPSEPDGWSYCLPDIGSSWSLSRLGHVVARKTGRECDSLGDFEAEPGRYSLDVHLARDGSRFHASKPRLVVFEGGGLEKATAEQGFLAACGLIVLATLGAGAIACSAILRRNQKSDALLTAWPLTVPGSQLPPRPAGDSGPLIAIRPRKPLLAADPFMGDFRTSTRRPMSSLHSYALLLSLVFFVLFLLCWSGYWLPIIPVGLKVRLLRPDAPGQRNPGIQPVIVQVRLPVRPLPQGDAVPHPSLWVNWRLVSTGDFETILQKELNQRPPDWPVYVEGARELDWMYVVKVIDRISSLHTRIVLLTSYSPAPERS